MMALHGFVSLLRDAKERNQTPRLVLRAGGCLDIVVHAVARDGVSGLTLGETPRGVIVPFSAICLIEDERRDVAATVGVLARAGMDQPAVTYLELLENSRRLSHMVTFHTPHARHTGLIVALAPGVVVLSDVTGTVTAVAQDAIGWLSIEG